MSVTPEILKKLTDLKLTGKQLAGVLEIIVFLDSEQEQHRLKVAQRTRAYRQRGGGNIPEDLRRYILQRDDYTCQECGSLEHPQIDHIYPVSKGGTTEENNLQVLCRPCNARKRDRIRKTIPSNSIEFQNNSDGINSDLSGIPSNITRNSIESPPLNGFPHPSLNPSSKNPPIGGQKRGSRLEIQTLPENWKAYCQTKRPDLDPHTTFEKFSNHWISKAGRDAIKLDWYRTWQNWVMNENQQKTAILVRTEPKKAGVITL